MSKENCSKCFEEGTKSGSSGSYNRSSYHTDAYERGYSYGKGQKDGYNNKYDTYLSGSKHYNDGWQNGWDNKKR